MGNLLGRTSRGRGRAIGLGLVAAGWPMLLLVAACGSGDDPVADLPDTVETAEDDPEPGLLPCAEDRHLAVFDLIGFLTLEGIEGLGPWSEGVAPTPRAGSVELTEAYRQHGYELLYITTIPPNFFGEVPLRDAVYEWLQANGYPTDPGTHFWGWDGVERPNNQTWVTITDELLRFSSEGVSVDHAYTENTDKAYAYATGGVPAASNYTLTPVEGLGEGAPTSAPTTLIPNDDLGAHAATIQQQPPICQVA